MRRLSSGSSATYCAVLNGTGELQCGIGDMAANDEITIDWVLYSSYIDNYYLL